MIHGPLILSMAALAVVVVGAALAAQKRKPGFAGAVLGSAVLALPVLGFTQWPTWSVADRHVYLPHLVLTGAIVAGLATRAAARTIAPVLLVVVGMAWLGRQQVMIWRNTDSLFRYLEAQPAFAWNPAQQAYIYQLWGAQAAEDHRPADAEMKNKQARGILVHAMLAEAEREHWAQAIEFSQRLEQSFGLPPELRRERARWRLAQGDVAGAGVDLAQAARELPGSPATEELIREWRRRSGRKDM
jgi:hypothetical protein